jgi:F-type H+-transporting ATPase subunit a
MAEIAPMEQFMVHKVVDLPTIRVHGLGAIDLSITNTVLFLLIAATLISVFFLTASRRAIVPGRMQALAEMLYDMVDNGLTGAMIGDKGRPFLPFIFTLFTLIAITNIIGVIPLSFTATSQLAVTATLGVMTFATVIVVGFVRNGIGFFKLFVPSGVHWGMAIFLAPIEFLSFAVRPLTLALRLFGNMMAGHVMLYLFATFVAALGLFALHGGLASLGFVGSALSLSMIVAVLGLEIAVAVIQAFVFATLACVYLNEVVNLGHGH